MENNRKCKKRYSQIAGILFLVFSYLFLFYGKKERQLYSELEERILQEQKKDECPEPEEVNIQKVEKTPLPVRVLLTDNSGAGYGHEDVLLQSQSVLAITGAVEAEYSPGTRISVRDLMEEGSIRVSARDPEGTISVLNLQRNQEVPSYQGVLEITAKEGRFYLINEVDMETYLKYVVPSEMPASYPLEALKAQAVCARTYAVSQMRDGRLKEYGADVDDTVSFQVYNTVSRQTNTDQAVDETEGQIMYYGGEPVQAYFFSTSCGYTSTDKVWGGETAAPYLKSIAVSEKTVETMALGAECRREAECSEEEFRSFICGEGEGDYEKEEPWYRWKITFPVDVIQKKIEEKYPQIGEFQEFAVRKRSEGGAVTDLEVIGKEDSVTISDEYAVREFFSPGDIPVLCRDGTERRNMKILPSSYFVLELVGEGETREVAVTGGGYGHGVGMSQNGAKHLAVNGMGWKDILHMFYGDISFSAEAENELF